ncbi:MAG: CPBP family intramembrane glutamic endopeptidase [Candidatus Neomarinimicrobiota bacterium]
MNKTPTNRFFILSPLIILLITHLTAIIFGKYFGGMVLIPVILIYWGLLAFILFRYGFDNIKRWLVKPQGHWGWIVLAGALGISSLPLFINNVTVFRDTAVLLLHIAFFIINPWLEEFYWRGLLLDVTKKWPTWLAATYSSVFFMVWHSAFAWQSDAVRALPFYITVLILGYAMVLIYKKTNSLRLCIFSHLLINIFNMGIPTLLNRIQF